MSQTTRAFVGSDRPNGVQQGPVYDFAREAQLVPVFKALLGFVSKDKARAALSQIEIEFHDDDIYLTATDGHALLTVRIGTEHLNREHPVRFTVSAESVRSFVDSQAHAPLDSDKAAEAFPEVRRVFPWEASASKGEPLAFGLDPALHKRLTTAFTTLGLTGSRSSTAVVECGDALSPVLVSVDDFSGTKLDREVKGVAAIIMPIRLV